MKGVKNMKVYLASPFFNEDELTIYREVISKLRLEGHEVFVPQEHDIPNGWSLPNRKWGEAVFLTDICGIKDCECVVVLNWGMYSDSGTAWECGYAYALGKKILNVVCGNSNEYSLMMLNGSHNYVHIDTFHTRPVEELFNYFFTDYSVEQK